MMTGGILFQETPKHGLLQEDSWTLGKGGYFEGIPDTLAIALSL